MASEEEIPKQHNIDSVWRRVNQIGDNQAKGEERLSALETKVDIGFTALQRSNDTMVRSIEGLAAKLDRPKPPPNYSLFVGIVMGALAIFGGYATLITFPISKATADNAQSISAILNSQRNAVQTAGSHAKELEWHGEWLRFMEQQVDAERQVSSNLSERISRMEGRHEMLVDRVKDIDDQGSRRWNRGRAND